MTDAAPFVWYELATTDVDAALAFYGAVLPWTAHPAQSVPMRYMLVQAGDTDVGGVMTLPPGTAPQPFWLGYVGSPGIEASVARFTGAGGTLHRGPMDIPNVGRIAILGDPQRAPIALFEPGAPGDPTSFDRGKPGHAWWNELRTPDPAAALGFYAGQFGWTAGESLDLGTFGAYQIIKAGEVGIGGIMGLTPGMPGAAWLFYFGVQGITAAAARIAEHGGTVLHGPAPVPGGMFVVQARDPQGAVFGLVGPE